jgi:hypothetical protein
MNDVEQNLTNFRLFIIRLPLFAYLYSDTTGGFSCLEN